MLNLQQFWVYFSRWNKDDIKTKFSRFMGEYSDFLVLQPVGGDKFEEIGVVRWEASI